MSEKHRAKIIINILNGGRDIDRNYTGHRIENLAGECVVVLSRAGTRGMFIWHFIDK